MLKKPLILLLISAAMVSTFLFSIPSGAAKAELILLPISLLLLLHEGRHHVQP